MSKVRQPTDCPYLSGTLIFEPIEPVSGQTSFWLALKDRNQSGPSCDQIASKAAKDVGCASDTCNGAGRGFISSVCVYDGTPSVSVPLETNSRIFLLPAL